MRFNTPFLIISVLALVLVSGCTGNFNDEGPPTGYEGLSIDVSEFPVTPVLVKDRFSFVIDLVNDGYYDANEAKLSVQESNNLERINGESPFSTGDVEGKRTRPEGGHEGPLFFTYLVKSVPGGGSSVESNVVSILCYSYKTEANLLACMGKSEEVCEFNDIPQNTGALSYGQGAPLAITDVQETLVPVGDGTLHVPAFTITVENSNTGEVFINAEDMVEKACSSEPLDPSLSNGFDYILTLSSGLRYDSRIDAGQDFFCNPESPRLNEGITKITCKLNEEHGVEFGNTYQTPLKVELDYVYRDFNSQRIVYEEPRS
jgi:hypothetical protein